MASKTFPIEVLTKDEVARLLAACSRRSFTGVRARALVTVFYRCGLRCSEALDLRPKDYDQEAGTLTVLRGKGAKRRVVGIDPDAAAVLDLWLVRRASLKPPRRAPVFCTVREGKRLLDKYIRALLPRLAERAGIEKRCHAHGLRHTFASEMREEGHDIGVISKALGHSSIAVTARYLDHVNPKAVVEAMRTR